MLNRRSDATERLLEVADSFSSQKKQDDPLDDAWRQGDVTSRLSHALVNGITEHIIADTEEARLAAEHPLHVIEAYDILDLYAGIRALDGAYTV